MMISHWWDDPLPADLPADVIAVGPKSGLQYVRPTRAMVDEMERLELEAFPTADPKDLYDAAELAHLVHDFPEGGVVGFDGPDRTRAVAVGLGVRTDFDFDHPQHNVKEFFEDAPTESGDDPDGDWYYGTDIVVSPDYRRRGIGRELYDLRKQVCRALDLAGIVAGGVIPGYADHKHELTADQYIDKVRAGELYDRTLTFQIENGFEAVCGLADYIADPAVDSWACLIVWRNPDWSRA
ncbi:MAG: GNAT family N-acetyltransferase [Actinomycetota bacterium]